MTRRRRKLLGSGSQPIAYPVTIGEFEVNTSGKNYQYTHGRTPPYVNNTGKTIDNIELVFSCFQGTTTEFNNNTTTIRASVEYLGAFTSGYTVAGGATRDLTLTAGTNGKLYITGLNIPNGGTFYIKTRGETGAAEFQPAQCVHGQTVVGGTVSCSGGADSADYTLSATVPATGGTHAVFPTAIKTFQVGNKPRLFGLIGDSIMKGSSSGGVSYAEEAVKSLGYGYINVAYQGSQLNTAWAKRISLFQAAGVTDVIMNFPVNDLNADKSLANIQSQFQTLWSALRAAGVQRIIQCTCTPFTETNISTPKTSPVGVFTGGAASRRAQVNAWERTQTGGGTNKVDYVYELADVFETSRDVGDWANGTMTTDFLHPTSSGATLAGANLASYLTSIGY